jgi:hypothetical protein
VRLRFAGLCTAAAVAALLVMAAPALAAPITINFESGAATGDKITNQYATPSGVPEGPTFEAPADAGFQSFGCGPGHLTTAAARSGTHSVVLDGCAGSEFGATATFFSMGYTTDAVSFWIALPGQMFSSEKVATTAFGASRNEIDQEVTTLGPQSATTFQQVSVTSTSDNIAFVAVELGTPNSNSSSPTGVTDSAVDLNSSALYLDDLTYDPPASPPNSSFVLGANPAGSSTIQGGHATVTIPITWTNNPNPSADPVTLTASTPSGVTASFSPNPTSAGSSTLTLTVAKTAPVGPTSVTVTGTVGSKTAQAVIPFGISAAFEVASPGAITLAPCTPKQVTLRVVTSLTQPVTIFVTIPNEPGAMITGISGSGGAGTISNAYEAKVTVTPQGGLATATVSLTAAPGASPAPAQAMAVEAGASGYSDQTNLAGTVRIEPGEVDNVTHPSLLGTAVRAPWLDDGGTPVTLTGAGFCPGTKVAIEDPDNAVAATSISGDGTSLTFSTPLGSVTGPIELLPPTGHSFSGPSLTVQSFRNTWGFALENADFHTLLTQDMEDQLLGKDETNYNVFGWLIRKPEAYEYQTITNKHAPGGLCFGFAYSSLEFFDDPSEVNNFVTSGGNNPFHIDTSNPTNQQNLVNYILERFSLQFTDQLIPYEVNAVLGVHGTNDDLNAIKQGLAAHEPVMIGMIHWYGASIAAHTVLAYDTQPLPDGSTAVDVVNSNEPYLSAEESNPSQHDEREFTKSEIIIKNGNWTFPEGADFHDPTGFPWSGSEADLVVYPHSALPIINGARPKLPNVFTGTVMVAFGSSADGVTQVSGSGGGALFDHGQIAPRTQWPKGAAPLPSFTGQPGPLQLLTMRPSVGGSLTATVHRGGRGGAMDMRLPGLQALLQAGAHPGQVDTVTVNPHADSIGYATSAAKASLGGTLLSSAGAARAAAGGASPSERSVQFQTSVMHRAHDTIAFPSGGQLSVRHTGPSARLSLTLSSFNSDGQPVAVALPPLRLASGETLQVAPRSWRSLGSSLIRVREQRRGRSTTRLVKGRTTGRRFASIRHASLGSLSHGRYGVALGLRVRRAPANAWLSVAVAVRRARHTVATTAPVQLIGSTLHSSTIALPLPHRLVHGRYSIAVRVLEASGSGPVEGSTLAARTVKTRT